MSTSKNKSVVFVTGGSRGIGKAIVEKFKSQHWLVAGCATTAQGAEKINADLNLICDVADVKSVRKAIETIISTFGNLDAIINNAGIISGADIFSLENNDDVWHQVMDVNLHGTYYV